MHIQERGVIAYSAGVANLIADPAMSSSIHWSDLTAKAGTQPLWKVWWLWGIPLDVARLLVYFSWARLAWRCSRNVEDRRWTPVARFALGAGFVSMAMF